MNYRALLFCFLVITITLLTATSTAVGQAGDPTTTSDLDPNCDCTMEDVPTQPAGEPVWGYADIHEHQFANLAYGGTVFWGSPFDEEGIEKALAPCDATKEFKTYTPDEGLNSTLADALDYFIPGASEILGWLFNLSSRIPIPYITNEFEDKGWAVHGSRDDYFPLTTNIHLPWQLVTGFNNNMATNYFYFQLEFPWFVPSRFHNIGGWPDFSGWPSYDQGGHQQMYYEWLERAYKGGQRLLVNLAVNNELLCELSIKREGASCDDMLTVDEQITAMYAMQDYVDSKCTGEKCGWYRIVKTPAEAREVIQNGKLAVIIGIEVDALFNCKWENSCSRKEIRDNVQKYYDAGVRHTFIVHFADNQFVGAALYPNPIKNLSAFFTTGTTQEKWDCSKMGYDDDCNALGLTPDGIYLLDQLMDKKMVIDIDHMSLKATGFTDENGVRHEGFLDTAKEMNYPVISSHAGTRPDERPGLEGSLSVSEAIMIRDMGGMVALNMPRGKCNTTQQFLEGVPEDDEDPDDNQILGYLDLVTLMSKEGSRPKDESGPESRGVPPTHVDYPGVALMNDFGAFLNQTGPRMDPDPDCGDGIPSYSSLDYPFEAFDGSGHEFDRVVTGDRTFDFNTEGLAHNGMMPDFLADVALGLDRINKPPEAMDSIFHSAEAYIRMWEKITYCHPDVDPPALSCSSPVAASKVGQDGQVFFDLPPAEDKYYCDWWPEVTTSISSGSTIETGITTLLATATDKAGLVDSCQFGLNVSCFGTNQALLDNGCTGMKSIQFSNFTPVEYDIEFSHGLGNYDLGPYESVLLHASDIGAEVLPSTIELTYSIPGPHGGSATTSFDTGCLEIKRGDIIGPLQVNEIGDPTVERYSITFVNISGAAVAAEVVGFDTFNLAANETFVIDAADIEMEILPDTVQLNIGTDTYTIDTLIVQRMDNFGPLDVQDLGEINIQLLHNHIDIMGSFEPAVPIDPTAVDVTFTIADQHVKTLSYTIPAGSFVDDGAGKYHFMSAIGDTPRFDAGLDLSTGSFALKVERVEGLSDLEGTELIIGLQMGGGVALNSADQTLEFQAQGSQLQYQAESPVDCVPIPEPELQTVVAGIQQVIADNPGSELADKLEDVQAKIETAMEELQKTPPDYQAALGNLEDAVGDLEAAKKDGLLEEEYLVWLDDIVIIAREIAASVIEDAANTPGVNQGKLNAARRLLTIGDRFHGKGKFREAVKKYKDATAMAEGALP